ncbi:immune-associated nucleotide-binding protein 9-like [Apium graveolens]|uniref:immune-associated nucleotide-binding protein 9-like n=1 Tax=Apium graveolens TaxID=4045 RepID=UPI003D78C919
MGGSSVEDWVIGSPSGEPRTLVLVGCTGNGKSATGNSILQKKAFVSEAKSSGVTHTCELRTAVSEDGQILNVIDTPGLFDCSAKAEFTCKEIGKCISMAKDGIHAVLFVLSVKTRFSEGEEAVLNSLRTLFGSKMTDYMILVFTGGDELEYHEIRLEDYLGRDCPKPLKELLNQCENRCVLFNNRTHSQSKKDEQVQELLSLMNLVLAKNDGKPYTDELFVELKRGTAELDGQNEEQLMKRITELVESKFRENTARLEQQLVEEKASLEQKLAEEKSRLEHKLAEEKARLEQQLVEEKAARLSAENMAHSSQEKSIDEIHKMRENLARAERELREQAGRMNCAIL